MAKKRNEITYLVVEAKPKNKAEFDQLGLDVRAEHLRTNKDGTKFILKWDRTKKARLPSFLDLAKTKIFTHDQMRKELTKKNSEWEVDFADLHPEPPDNAVIKLIGADGTVLSETTYGEEKNKDK